MTLRDVTAEQFARLSALLDEALDRPAPERGRWIDELALRDSASASLLRDLLASASANADGFLETREILERRRPDAGAGSLAGSMVGPWRVLAPLGRGGMGEVWLAERADGLFQRRVALKLVHPHLAQAAAERFAREREILATLDHPGIARLLDAGLAADGRPYLALEYVEGEPLVAWCDARGATVQERAALFLEVARAVAFAHANLVIHRDLKPSNVLVTREGRVRLLDFGIAKLASTDGSPASQLTQVAGPAFTPDYASPEQIAGRPVTTASDVYSLGVVLHELLCGTRPYRLARESLAALEDAILTADPVRPSHAPMAAVVAERRSTTLRRLRRALAGDLDTIVGKALRKDPADRYATADALAQDLDRHLRGEPVLARAPGAGYQLGKFVRRYRWGVGAGTAVVAALVAATVVSLWQAGIADEHAARAQQEAAKAKVVQDFLLDLFKANSIEQPEPLKAQATTARELLDLGARRAAAALAGAPEARFEVLGTLGEMYYQLGLTDEAALRQRERVEAARQAYARDDPRLAAALVDYADAIIDSSRRDELLPVLDEAKALLDAAGDASSLLRGRLLSTYAKAHSYTSMDATRRYADEALALYRRHHPGSVHAKAALQAAATTRHEVGDYEGAERLYGEALAEARRQGPAASQVVPLVGIAMARSALGDVEGAERHYRDALGVARSVYGDRHGETLQSMVKLGRLLHQTARRAEGRRLMDDAAAAADAAGAGIPAFVTAVVAGLRGQALLREGRPDEAAPLIALDLDDARANYPRSAPLANALHALAALHNVRGRHDEALAALAEAEAIEASLATGSDPARLNYHRLERARALVAMGAPTRALAELDRVVAPAAAARMPVVLHDVDRRILAAEAWLALGNVDAAERLAGEALAAVVAAPTRRYFPILEAAATQRVGLARLRRGQAADARPLLERAVALRAEHNAPESPDLAQARIALAACLRTLGQGAAAATLEREARRALAAHSRVSDYFRAAVR